MANHLSRRDLIRGVFAGAVSLAFTPAASVQLGPPPGVITLRYNENPYGPSPGALKAAAEAAALGAYYPGAIETDLLQSDCPPERAQTREHGPFVRIERGPAGSARGMG